MTTKEIITLQFGHYSNFVGAHWWNLQEFGFSYDPSSGVSDINHDVLYREGKTIKNEVTYTPRLLLVDSKGSLDTLPEQGTLYGETISPDELIKTLKNTAIETQILGGILKTDCVSDVKKNVNQLQKQFNLQKEVKVWSDFLYTRFHPRSVNILQGYHHNDESTPFNLYSLGINTWNSKEFQEDFCDKIRNYVEECNYNQGFQVLLDSIDGFSGLATSSIQHIKDEYEKKAVFALPFIPTYSLERKQNNLPINNLIRTINIALTLNSLAENSSLFIPLSVSEKGWRQPESPQNFHHINYNPHLDYHSSAILASAMDTFSLQYRLKSSSFTLADLCTDFNGYGRKCAAASLCLPFPLNSGDDFIDCLNKWDGPLWKSITPRCTIDTNYMLQNITLRGISEHRLKKPASTAGEQRDLPAYKCNTVQEMLDFYINCNSTGSATNVITTSAPLHVKSPFPNIFDKQVGVNGDIVIAASEKVENVRVLSGIHSGCSIGSMFESLNAELDSIKFNRFHQFKSAGMEQDEFNECVDNLKTLRECYEDNCEL